MGKLCFGNAPKGGDLLAMLGVFNVTASGKLITTLPVFARALAIALAGDGTVTATRVADAASGEHEADTREHVFHAFGVMFDAAGVQEHRLLRFRPHFRRTDNASSRDAGDFR